MSRIHASDMQTWKSSEASCLTVSKTRSRVAGLHFLSDTENDDMPLSEQNPPLNSPIHAVLGVLKMVETSASESELGAYYINEKIGVCERRTLEEM